MPKICAASIKCPQDRCDQRGISPDQDVCPATLRSSAHCPAMCERPVAKSPRPCDQHEQRPARTVAFANGRVVSAIPRNVRKDPRHSSPRPCAQHGMSPDQERLQSQTSRSSAHCPAMCERPFGAGGRLAHASHENICQKTGATIKCSVTGPAPRPPKGRASSFRQVDRFGTLQIETCRPADLRPSSTEPSGPAPATSAPATPDRQPLPSPLPPRWRLTKPTGIPDASARGPPTQRRLLFSRTLANRTDGEHPWRPHPPGTAAGSTAALNRIRSDLTPRPASQPLSLSPSHPLSLSASQPLSLSASQPLSLSASQPLSELC